MRTFSSRKKIQAAFAILLSLGLLSTSSQPATADSVTVGGTVVTWNQAKMTKPTSGCKYFLMQIFNADSVLFSEVKLLNGNDEEIGSALQTGKSGTKELQVCAYQDMSGPLTMRVISTGSHVTGDGETTIQEYPFRWASKSTTITCLKKSNKSVVKKVTGVSPKCPAGYVKK